MKYIYMLILYWLIPSKIVSWWKNLEIYLVDMFILLFHIKYVKSGLALLLSEYYSSKLPVKTGSQKVILCL